MFVYIRGCKSPFASIIANFGGASQTDGRCFCQQVKPIVTATGYIAIQNIQIRRIFLENCTVIVFYTEEIRVTAPKLKPRRRITILRYLVFKRTNSHQYWTSYCEPKRSYRYCQYYNFNQALSDNLKFGKLLFPSTQSICTGCGPVI